MMTSTTTDFHDLRKQFENCSQTLIAMGDRTRQHIVFTMLEMGCNGIRVGDIAARTHLSRPAVSHHIRILKDIGIIRMKKDGTKNYYYLDSRQEELEKMQELLTNIRHIIERREN